LVAVAVKVYAVPLVSPVTVHDPERGVVALDGVMEHVRLPGDDVTVKLSGSPPVVALPVTVTVA
jgi:hypothetical protein